MTYPRAARSRGCAGLYFSAPRDGGRFVTCVNGTRLSRRSGSADKTDSVAATAFAADSEVARPDERSGALPPSGATPALAGELEPLDEAAVGIAGRDVAVVVSAHGELRDHLASSSAPHLSGTDAPVEAWPGQDGAVDVHAAAAALVAHGRRSSRRERRGHRGRRQHHE